VWGAGAHLMGRVTYEEMAAFWPTSTSDYARSMNEIPKVVFSKTLKQAGWAETRIAGGDLREEIGRLKREPGNDLIAYGGAVGGRLLPGDEPHSLAGSVRKVPSYHSRNGSHRPGIPGDRRPARPGVRRAPSS
jgi:hypothetical protein